MKCINYSNQELECLLQIDPQGMLFESEIYQCKALSLSDGNIKIDGVSDDFGVILSTFKV